MINALKFMLFMLAPLSCAAADSIVYLSCPHLDSRAPDLLVVLDRQSGTASLQSPSMGAGLNFTEKASFGPEKVVWRKDSSGFQQTYSINRSSLELERKTFSTRTSSTDIEKSDCTLVKSSTKNKF